MSSKTLYFKQGHRYHPVDQSVNFTGFPANGVFVVNSGMSLCLSWEEFNKIDDRKAFICGLIFNQLSKFYDDLIDRSHYSLVQEILDLKSISLNKIHFVSIDNIKKGYEPANYYEKKGTTYKKIGEAFKGFPSTGVFVVEDGRNNQIRQLDFDLPLTLNLDFDKEDMLKCFLEFKNERPISAFDIIRFFALKFCNM